MAYRDLYNSLRVESLLVPLVRTADATSNVVDTKGYGSLVLVAHVGAAGDTLSASTKFEFEVEESDDTVTWSDVADADLQGAVDGTNDGTFGVIDASGDASAIYKAGYLGNKRYVRVVVNFTGTHSTGTSLSVAAYKSNPDYAPVS